MVGVLNMDESEAKQKLEDAGISVIDIEYIGDDCFVVNIGGGSEIGSGIYKAGFTIEDIEFMAFQNEVFLTIRVAKEGV